MAWTTPCGTSTEPHRPSPADIRQVAGGVPSPTNLASDALLPCLSASPGLIRALLGSPGTLVRASSRSSTDRASDYGSEGWGFESLRLRTSRAYSDQGVGPFCRRGPADSDCSVVPRLAITLHGGGRAGFRVLGEISGVSGAGRRERRSRAAKGVVPGRAGRQHRPAEAAERRRHVEEQSCRGSRMPWIFPGLVTEPRPTLARTTTPGEHERTGRTVRHLPGRVGRMRPHRLRDTAKLQYVEQPLLAPGP